MKLITLFFLLFNTQNLFAVTEPASDFRLRAYVTNYGGEEVSVIDLDDGKELTKIKTGKAPHGVAIASDGSQVFVSNTASNDLSIIDVNKRSETKRVSVGSAPKRLAVGLVITK